MPNPTLTVGVNGDTTNLNTNLGAATKSITVFGQSIPTTRIEALVAAGKKAVEFTHGLAQQGRDAAAAQTEFERALAATNTQMSEWETKTNEAITAAGKLGFTDDETRDSILQLTTETGDLDTALAELPAVMDLARGKQVDLATATDAVTKAMGENGLSLALNNMFGGTLEATDAQGRLQEAFGLTAGAALNMATDSEIMKDRMAIAMEAAAESVGGVLGGAFAEAREALITLIIALLGLIKTVLPILVPLVNALGKALAWVVEGMTFVAEKAAGLVDWIGKIGEKIGGIWNDIKNIDASSVWDDFKQGGILDLDPFGIGAKRGTRPSGSSAQSAGGGKSGGGGGATMSAPVINIYGDPSVIEAKVTKALRDYTRRNGAGGVLQPGRS